MDSGHVSQYFGNPENISMKKRLPNFKFNSFENNYYQIPCIIGYINIK